MEVQTHVREQDPVCGMQVDPTENELVSLHKGRKYYFCAPGCREAFERNPEKYLRRKGPFGRFLDRLAKSNKETFGSSGPSCCH
jgi:YHS domain-containing protein